MLTIRLFHFLLGYVRFRVGGDFPERLLNICTAKRISVWDIAKQNNAVEAKMLVRDYKKMRKLRAKTGVRVKVLERFGFPFWLKAYRKRAGLPAGAVLFFAVVHFLSGFVWSVQVSGNDRVPAEQVLAACREIGVEVGVPIDSIDSYDARVKLMLKVDGLSWAAFNIEGTRVSVDVTEIRPLPEREADAPCNLKAARDGMVVAMEVTSGRSVVSVGDAVVAGDMLVSGTIEYETGQTALKHAAGSVIARTDRTLSCRVDYEQVRVEQTGQVKTRSVLQLFWLRLPLYLGSVGQPYQRDVERRPLVVNGVQLPVGLTTGRFYLTRQTHVRLDKAQAQAQAEHELAQLEAQTFAGAKILSRTPTVATDSTGLTLSVDYQIEENIAIEDFLLLNTTN